MGKMRQNRPFATPPDRPRLIVSFRGPNSGRCRHSEGGLADPRDFSGSKIGGRQHRTNGLLVVERIDLVRKALSSGAVASEKAQNETTPWPQDTANLPQARGWITPEIERVDGKRPVKGRRIKWNRSAVCFAKLDSTLGNRKTVSANRYVQHIRPRRRCRRRDRQSRRPRVARWCDHGQSQFPTPDQTAKQRAGELHVHSNPPSPEP